MKKNPNNPFTTGGYWGKPYFCDREEELAWLEEQIANDRNVVLHSWRRMGKTALIKRFFEEWETKGRNVSLHIDLMGTRSMQGAIGAIIQGIHERFGKTSAGISNAFQQLVAHVGASLSFDPHSGMPQLQFNPANPNLPDRSLNALGEFLSNRKELVIIALDEFQQVTRYPEGNAEALFRSWMQDFPSIRFMFSGSHRKMMTSIFTGANRPFYKSTQLKGIDPIPEEKYISFIQHHFRYHKKQIGKAIIKDILAWSRGQTYTIQLICNKLFGSCTRVTREDLKRILETIIEEEKPYFTAFTRLLTDTQWKLLKAIAKEEPLSNPLGNPFIERHHLGATSSVNTALKSLQEKELVIREGNHYLVHEVILARWLQRL